MGSMTLNRFVHWRANCEFHAARRSKHRGLNMSAHDIAELSQLIDRAREAFEIPNISRYWIGVHRGDGSRIRVVYDTTLSTIVTAVGRRS